MRKDSLLPVITILPVVILFIAIKKFIPSKLPIKFDDKQRNDVSGSVLCILNALTLVLLSIGYLFTGNEGMVESLIYVSCTFFTMELLGNETLKQDMKIHHAISLALGGILTYQVPNINYSLYGAVGFIEISSVFLYTKYILATYIQFLNGKSSDILLSPVDNGNFQIGKVYKNVNRAFLGTFFMFRTVLLPLLMIRNMHMLTSNPISYLLFSAFTFLNIGWSVLMYKRYIQE
jgi:hypothetical protein